jgi:hypothetical protein
MAISPYPTQYAEQAARAERIIAVIDAMIRDGAMPPPEFDWRDRDFQRHLLKRLRDESSRSANLQESAKKWDAVNELISTLGKAMGAARA